MLAFDSLPGHTPLPQHLLQFLASYRKDTSYITFTGAHPERWPEQKGLALHTELADILLAADASSQGLVLAPSNIPQGGMGVFAARTFKAKERIAWYGGTLVYEDLSKHTAKLREWGPAGFGVTKQRFESYGLELLGDPAEGLLEQVGGNDGPPVQGLWVVAAPFCIGGFFNDYRTTTDADATSVAHHGGRECNAALQVMDLESLEDLKDPFAAFIEATTLIESGEELFVNYGSKFSFSSGN